MGFLGRFQFVLVLLLVLAVLVFEDVAVMIARVVLIEPLGVMVRKEKKIGMIAELEKFVDGGDIAADETL